MDMKCHICFIRILLLVRIDRLLRDPGRSNILESEHLSSLKIINLLLVLYLHFSNALTFVFVTRQYCAVDPIYYFLQFAFASFENLLLLFVGALLLGWRFELVRLHQAG